MRNNPHFWPTSTLNTPPPNNPAKPRRRTLHLGNGLEWNRWPPTQQSGSGREKPFLAGVTPNGSFDPIPIPAVWNTLCCIQNS